MRGCFSFSWKPSGTSRAMCCSSKRPNKICFAINADLASPTCLLCHGLWKSVATTPTAGCHASPNFRWGAETYSALATEEPKTVDLNEEKRRSECTPYLSSYTPDLVFSVRPLKRKLLQQYSRMLSVFLFFFFFFCFFFFIFFFCLSFFFFYCFGLLDRDWCSGGRTCKQCLYSLSEQRGDSIAGNLVGVDECLMGSP